MTNSVAYLGYIIDEQGIHPDPAKIKSVKEVPEPRNVADLRSLLVLINYYDRFLPNLASILAPLYELVCKGARWEWKKRQN